MAEHQGSSTAGEDYHAAIAAAGEACRPVKRVEAGNPQFNKSAERIKRDLTNG